jgi:hypothetical protein
MLAGSDAPLTFFSPMNSSYTGTREEALEELDALAHDVAAVVALAKSGRTAEEVMQAWQSVRSGGALLAVTASLARWKTLEALPPRICPMDGKTLSAGGAHD